SVQTYFAKKAAAYLSNQLNTTVTLEGIYFNPFASLVLNGLYIEDLEGDTLLYSQRLAADINLGKLANSEVEIRHVDLSDSRFSLQRDEKGSNIGFIPDYFRPKADTNRVKPVKITWNIHEVDLDSVSVRYRVVGSIPKRNAINFRDIELTGISGKFSDID